MKKHAPRILLLDSGVGGLSIYKSIKHLLPHIGVLYVGDNDALPYGEKSDDFILNRVIHITRHYELHYQPDLVVIACNTASTLALPDLRSATTIPIIGVVPAIKVAGEISRSRRIGLLATPATVERLYIDELQASFADDCNMLRVGSSHMVGMAEAKLSGDNLDMDLLKREIEPFLENDIDTVVLGCTHFPLLHEELQSLGPNIHWIDSSTAIANRVQHLLKAQNLFCAPHPSSHTEIDSAEFTAEISDTLNKKLQQLGFSKIQDNRKELFNFNPNP